MAKPDHSIDPRILDSAKGEFLTFGYERASLKRICENARVTTGALYNRYAGKEELFCAVVEPTLNDLNAVMEERCAVDPRTLTDEALIDAWDMDNESMMWWYRFLQARRDGFVLLLAHSDGTRYANFQHDWVQRMTEATYAYYQAAWDRGLVSEPISETEMHILLTAFWSTIYEPFIHGCAWEEIEAHSAIVCKLFDWYAALGFKKNRKERG